MSLIKAFCIAFSMYSKIPMPQFPWEEKDMRYTMCFFPFVGAVIGALEWGWYLLCSKLGLGGMCFSLVGTAIPILVSGGFHVDGYMDTQDALHSYQSKEKKLEILKDPHIGAFAVIRVILYYLLYTAAFSALPKGAAFGVFGTGFVISRALSAVAMFTFPLAKKDGSLASFAGSGQKKAVLTVVILELVAVLAFGLWLHPVVAAFVWVAALLTFAYYRYKSVKEFGGITGDLAGYFVTLCELGMIWGAVVGGLL